MKRFVYFFLVLPMLASCVVQESYYEPGYYSPPPPRVEMRRWGRSHYHHEEYYPHRYRAAPPPRVRVEQYAQGALSGVTYPRQATVHAHVPQDQAQVQIPAQVHKGNQSAVIQHPAEASPYWRTHHSH